MPSLLLAEVGKYFDILQLLLMSSHFSFSCQRTNTSWVKNTCQRCMPLSMTAWSNTIPSSEDSKLPSTSILPFPDFCTQNIRSLQAMGAPLLANQSTVSHYSVFSTQRCLFSPAAFLRPVQQQRFYRGRLARN